MGDDAVWGSRSLLFPANALHALPIKIGHGANVADRCVVLAGVTVEAEGCLGSGSLAAEGFTFPEVGGLHKPTAPVDPCICKAYTISSSYKMLN